MANLIKGMFGGEKAAPSSDDADFADFARAADPSPIPIVPSAGSPLSENPAFPTGAPAVPYTKWYRVWERTSPSDFVQEAFVLPFIIIVVLLHVWGRGANRRKAKNWSSVHAPILDREYSHTGFGRYRRPTVDEAQGEGLAKSLASNSLIDPEKFLREKSGHEFIGYASGRQNVAFLDINLSMYKRYNPITSLIEFVLSALFDSWKAPAERMEAVANTFDGREKDMVPVVNQQEQDELESRVKGLNSSYDGFVWAIVHKDLMRHIRDERYDISLTFTKDHPKLPNWATVMSESAEITDQLLTADFVKALERAGERTFETLIISDQPVDKPLKLNETIPRKRISLSLRLPSSDSTEAYKDTVPIFEYFVRLPDLLASQAHYRPEVLRKVRTTREEEIRKLKKVDDDEKAEERKAEADRKKKETRDAKLKGLSADEQRKYLDKEREKDARKSQKKMTRKG